MPQSTTSVSYKEFSRVYAESIQGRTFVEDLSYYKACKPRFWEAFRRIDALGLPPGSKVLDIGGGIMAVLAARLLGFDAMVGDVNERARADVEELGLGFVIFDLFSDGAPPVTGLDLVILTEVIEHIPQPPYLVLQRIAKLIAPGGRLFLTTPNGHRIRNILYMMAGKEILGIYRYPEPGMALGHQHEYTMKQMLWQAGHAGFEVELAEYYEDGFKGATLPARIAWMVVKPLSRIPRLRNSMVMVLRRPAGDGA
ncbi:hypothetical protein RGUI_4203 (plasmid) [Rhodovulum sp. P5]|uniref:class I SAM-dependent methyltransferase n=1 Tax=Rhodovulum sp. P5 TaxID=1564506 RepID=UPI0009C3BBA1|nr:class I SAM-dependent methyltransferase [Rhodovulum sp. P5]ARE42520.1 hypothetical protein RGUI_4203 [Rhodovulum sp. P5]